MQLFFPASFQIIKKVCFLSVYLDHGRVSTEALGCSNALQNAIQKGPRQNDEQLIQFAWSWQAVVEKNVVEARRTFCAVLKWNCGVLIRIVNFHKTLANINWTVRHIWLSICRVVLKQCWIRILALKFYFPLFLALQPWINWQLEFRPLVSYLEYIFGGMS